MTGRTRRGGVWEGGGCGETNIGGVLKWLGGPVGRELGKYSYKGGVDRGRGDGSVMIVVATDAPISDRNLERLATRAIMGLARTGSRRTTGPSRTTGRTQSWDGISAW